MGKVKRDSSLDLWLVWGGLGDWKTPYALNPKTHTRAAPAVPAAVAALCGSLLLVLLATGLVRQLL